LVNNEIYVSQKTVFSHFNERTGNKTSPFGTVEEHFQVGELVIGAKGKFSLVQSILMLHYQLRCYIEAANTMELRFIEVLQKLCHFNDGIHDYDSRKRGKR